MRRISVVVGLFAGLAILTGTAAVSAQAPRRIARVGILNAGASQDPRVDELRKGRRDLGYVEGHDFVAHHGYPAEALAVSRGVL